MSNKNIFLMLRRKKKAYNLEIKPVKYKCPKCLKIFDKVSNFERHQNMKKDCAELQSKKTESNNDCSYCGELFTTKYSLARHIKTCKLNPIVINLMVNVNTYNINNFGNDNINVLTLGEVIEIANADNIIFKMIDLINFDKRENHNILYTHIKTSYCYVYENEKWFKESINDAIINFVDSKIRDLKLIYEKHHEKLDEKSRSNIMREINRLDYEKHIGKREYTYKYIEHYMIDFDYPKWLAVEQIRNSFWNESNPAFKNYMKLLDDTKEYLTINKEKIRTTYTQTRKRK